MIALMEHPLLHSTICGLSSSVIVKFRIHAQVTIIRGHRHRQSSIVC
jgi:hypothetical protein